MIVGLGKQGLRLAGIPEPFFCLRVAMRATWPATGPSLAFKKLGTEALYMIFSGLRFLDDGYPADPFITGQRGKVVPFLQYPGLGNQGAPQIIGHFMYNAFGDG